MARRQAPDESNIQCDGSGTTAYAPVDDASACTMLCSVITVWQIGFRNRIVVAEFKLILGDRPSASQRSGGRRSVRGARIHPAGIFPTPLIAG